MGPRLIALALFAFAMLGCEPAAETDVAKAPEVKPGEKGGKDPAAGGQLGINPNYGGGK